MFMAGMARECRVRGSMSYCRNGCYTYVADICDEHRCHVLRVDAPSPGQAASSQIVSSSPDQAASSQIVSGDRWVIPWVPPFTTRFGEAKLRAAHAAEEAAAAAADAAWLAASATLKESARLWRQCADLAAEAAAAATALEQATALEAEYLAADPHERRRMLDRELEGLSEHEV